MDRLHLMNITRGEAQHEPAKDTESSDRIDNISPTEAVTGISLEVGFKVLGDGKFQIILSNSSSHNKEDCLKTCAKCFDKKKAFQSKLKFSMQRNSFKPIEAEGNGNFPYTFLYTFTAFGSLSTGVSTKTQFRRQF